MNLLLDTVAILLLSNDDPRMPSAAKAAYRDPANSACVSVVSIWEILVKSGLGKLPFQVQLTIYSTR